MKKVALVVCVFLLIGSLSFAGGSGEKYPTKAVSVICPWSAGGGTDTLLRALAKETEKALGQPITVVNNTGGGGAVGHNAIRTAKPDGYTWGMVTFELNSLPPQGLIPFTYKDFDNLMLLNVDAPALTVKKDSPFNNVKDFIDYAKAHPGEVSIGNSGPGSVWHIAAGLMAEKTGVKVKYMPFDGAAPAVTALVGGHLTAVSVSVAEVRGQVQSGNLKILGVMDTKRTDLFPDVPTFQEQGLDVTFGTWRGMAIPKGVDPKIKEVITSSLKKGFDSPDFQATAKKMGLNLVYKDEAGFTEFLAKNAADVEAVMKSLGLTKK